MLSCLSYLCYSEPERRKRSLPTIWRHWVLTAAYISLTGYTGQSFHLYVRARMNSFDCRYFSEGAVDPIAVVAGIVQTGLYLDFFYVYFTKYVISQSLSLAPIIINYMPFCQSTARPKVRVTGLKDPVESNIRVIRIASCLWTFLRQNSTMLYSIINAIYSSSA